MIEPLSRALSSSLPVPIARTIAAELARRAEVIMQLLSAPWTMPDSVRKIVDVIGKDALLALVFMRGGTRLNVPSPRRVNRRHWLSRAIGPDRSQALAREFGGGWVDLPTLSRLAVFLRPSVIDKHRRNELSRRQIATALGVSVRTIARAKQ